MTNELVGKTVAFLVANEGVEEVELTRPWAEVEEAGGWAVLAAPTDKPVQAFNHLDKSHCYTVDITTDKLKVGAYDAIVLPGGVANPDQLRTDEAAVKFVKSFFEAGKPAAVICHGSWTLVEADVVRGRTVASWPSLQTDIRNAGGSWVDEAVVACTNGPNTLVTSRNPDDLDVFCSEFVRVFADHGRRSES
jgi:protease I